MLVERKSVAGTGLRWLSAVAVACVLCPTLAFGQAVQLPTFRQFTGSSTVSVPDRGSALLGSVSSASEGRNSRGVPILGKVPGLSRGFRNQGIGRSLGTSQLRVNATIINLDEMDRAILESARNSRPTGFAGDPAVRRQANFLSQNVGRGSVQSVADLHRQRAPEPVQDVEAIRRQNQIALENQRREAWQFIEKGKAAEAQSKYGVAKIYYQMAAKRTQGDLQQKIVDRIAYVDSIRAGVPANPVPAARVAARD